MRASQPVSVANFFEVLGVWKRLGGGKKRGWVGEERREDGRSGWVEVCFGFVFVFI